jgi:hypothetical protein
MSSTTLTASLEDLSSNRHRTHVCPDCGRLHEVVPTCVVCDEAIQLRRYWYEMGFVQGKRESELEFKFQRESLINRIIELGGSV